MGNSTMPDGSKPVNRVEAILDLVNRRMEELSASRYFHLCKTGDLTKGQLLGTVEQLYCFSTFFERILTRRMSKFNSDSNPALVRLARRHLKEEIGHADLFRKCLLSNGYTNEQVLALSPRTYTKCLFGYLLATVEYEDEIVTNVAIMQVMELIGLNFFESTIRVMTQHGLEASVFEEHAEDDKTHSGQGLDLYRTMSDQRLADSLRVISDLFRVMTAALDDWISGR
jgi:pyrroloquinoline quinone (PQQ) biosynthesis protein C